MQGCVDGMGEAELGSQELSEYGLWEPAAAAAAPTFDVMALLATLGKGAAKPQP